MGEQVAPRRRAVVPRWGSTLTARHARLGDDDLESGPHLAGTVLPHERPVLAVQEVSSGPETLINRDLSWLDFNARVLALAEDPSLPLLERVRFLAIFSRNLDEFFQVRVGGLKQQIALGVEQRSADGMSSRELLRAVTQRVREMVARQSRCFIDDVRVALRREGIDITEFSTLDDEDRSALSAVFSDTIFPVLTPLAVDPAHPFPYISNLSLNLAVVVGDSDDSTTHVARIKVPPLLQRFVPLPDGRRFVPLEQVIAAHLSHLFPQMEIVSQHPFR
ncbi:MAG: RNA degradosome polyphosphate kinase, partial [Candidatus Dormibacteraeota bacterium]|nr:RNA degradosome polyphosphate kinase [Candidatus Dormibacteraeota bacterium]